MLRPIQRIDVVSSNNIEIVNEVIHHNMHNTTSRSRSKIQSTESMFKLNRFNDSKKGSIRKSVGDKEGMADVADIPGDANNQLSFKNNVEYE